MLDFSGKTVMITGASGTIGSGMSTCFMGHGASLLAVDIDSDGLDRLEKECESAVGAFHSACIDITDREAVIEAVAIHAEQHQAVDILINNVGGGASSALSNLTPEIWERDIELNLTAAYHCVDSVKDAMLARGAGVIVNIGSVNGLTSIGHPAYSAAKAGLISYTRAIAVEYGPKGIRANIICPATVSTNLWHDRTEKNPDVFDALKKWYPLGTFPEPCDIAFAAVFLASDMARMITGAVLPVDAGLTAGNRILAGELTLEDF